MFRLLLIAAASLIVAASFAQESVPTPPHWIWHGEAAADQHVLFQQTFDVSAEAPRGHLTGTCDNHMTVTLNGEKVLEHGTWERVVQVDVTKALVTGANVLEVHARNDGGPAGLALRLVLTDGTAVCTDGDWLASADLEEPAWSPATSLGLVGDASLPWTDRVDLERFDAPGAPPPGRNAPPQSARPAKGIHLPEGFVAERLYDVPRKSQGSWVALAKDDSGRLYASDQADRGLYRITPAKLGDPTSTTVVEPIDVPVSGAQGLCWAFGALYANCNGTGLFRITDTDGDDRLDHAQSVLPLGHGSEHGPHAVIPTPDGTGLFVLAGNHTALPPIDGSRAPSNWGEDLLLPRRWDARGHAVGKLAPGGWIVRCDPDGSNVQVISSGYRNPYDLALNQDGELFTYDADMEYDVGSPWYRPTRICHVTSGSEYGWRSGTGKWPAYYEDSLPSVVDIGPGSPTGILFGMGMRAPAQWQDKLFVLDWTFGTIHAVQLAPTKGSAYVGSVEPFAWGKPFALTDAVIGDDGSMYVTVGGRGSRSSLYRITYRGTEPSSRAIASGVDPGAAARARRHQLEAYHGGVFEGAVDDAWPELASSDRFLRFAARISIENQPVATWRARALAETRPQAAVTALIALARQGAPEDLGPVLDALGRLDLSAMQESQVLAALRAYALAFVRLGQPDQDQYARVVAKLDPLLPSESPRVNAELVRILAHLQSPTVVPKTLALIAAAKPTEPPAWGELITRNDQYGGPIAKMLANMPPIEGLGYAFQIRHTTEGWTPNLRRHYFRFFLDASQHPGGASYAGFLENMRADAADHLSVIERRSLSALLQESLVVGLPENVTPAQGPGREWSVAEAIQTLGPKLEGRNHARGENLFHATRCSACHRFDGMGGAIGPDLTTVANKFAVADLMEAILEPDRAISDQYGSSIVSDEDGFLAEGIVLEDGDEIFVYPRDPNATPATFRRDEVVNIQESSTSQMPSGLLDQLSAEELKDLVAYLLAGGDPDADVFR
jgi:putative heme-binding domain-containing protein